MDPWFFHSECILICNLKNYFTLNVCKKLKNKKQTLPHHSPTWLFSSAKSYPDNSLRRTSPFSIWPCLPPLPQPPAFLHASHWPLHSATPFPLGPCCSLAANTVHPSPHTGTRTLPGCIYTSAFTSSRKFLKRRAPPPYWTVVPGPSWADGTCQPLGTQADKQLKKIEKPSFKMIFLNPREEKMTKALCLLTWVAFWEAFGKEEKKKILWV